VSWAGAVPAVISILAAAVMVVAVFLPYLQSPWPGTALAGTSTGVPFDPFASASLAQGPDPFFVLVALVLLGGTAAAYLLGIRRQITGAASFGAALAVALAAIYPASGVGSPIGYGFYLFVVGSLVAAMAGLVMVVMSFRGTRLGVVTALPGAVALLAVGVMSVASFLPDAQYPWTDGIFSLPSSGIPGGPLETSNFAGGSYAFSILLTLVVLGGAAAIHLVGMHRRFTAVVSLSASLAALALAVLYLPTLDFGPALIDYGFVVFVAAASLAAIAGLAMLVLSFRETTFGVPVTAQSFAPNNGRGA
jgi:hypothetical protein